MPSHTQNEILKALFQQLFSQPGISQQIGGGVPTASQQGLTQGQGPVLQPPTPPVPNAPGGQQGNGQQGTGLLSKIMQLIQSPGVLPTAGAIGSAFAGRDQLADFQRVTQQNRQTQLAKRAASAEEARVDISRKNLRVSEGNLTARQEEERNRNVREQAKATAAAAKLRTDNKKAIIGIKISNKQPVSEEEFVGGYGEAGRGVSIKGALQEDQVTLHFPDNRKMVEAFGGKTSVTVNKAQVSGILTQIFKETPNPKSVVIDGVIMERNPLSGAWEEVFDIGREDIDKPRPFPPGQQKIVREALIDLVPGFKDLPPGKQTDMINLAWNVAQTGDAPQPVTSKVSTGAWQWMKENILFIFGAERTFSDVVTGIEDPSNPTRPSLSDRANEFIETGQ